MSPCSAAKHLGMNGYAKIPGYSMFPHDSNRKARENPENSSG